MATVDLSIAIGGAAGQGIATPGDILARIFVRRGLHLNAYVVEQTYRFNERKCVDGSRFRKVLRAVTGKRITYRELTRHAQAAAD